MEEQVVTIDVVPQTVTEVIYLSPEDTKFERSLEIENYYSSSDDERDNEIYEIGCVDATQVEDMPLVYDQSQSFVMLSNEYQIDHDNNQQDNQVLNEKKIATKRKKFTCRVCNCKFSSRKKLFHHRVLHKSSMETNLRNVESINSKVTNVCKVCGEQFERTQALSIHFRKCHQNISIQHSENTRDENSSEFVVNYDHYNETPKFSCNICGCPCVNDIALLFHYKKHEPKNYTCDVCDAGYNNENDFVNHKKTHNVQFLYACNKCDESFPTTSLVSYHIRQVHAQRKVVKLEENFQNNKCLNSTNSSALKCIDKKKTFENPSQFPRRKYTCKVCKLQFRFQQALVRHENGHTK